MSLLFALSRIITELDEDIQWSLKPFKMKKEDQGVSSESYKYLVFTFVNLLEYLVRNQNHLKQISKEDIANNLKRIINALEDINESE